MNFVMLKTFKKIPDTNRDHLRPPTKKNLAYIRIVYMRHKFFHLRGLGVFTHTRVHGYKARHQNISTVRTTAKPTLMFPDSVNRPMPKTPTKVPKHL